MWTNRWHFVWRLPTHETWNSLSVTSSFNWLFKTHHLLPTHLKWSANSKIPSNPYIVATLQSRAYQRLGFFPVFEQLGEGYAEINLQLMRVWMFTLQFCNTHHEHDKGTKIYPFREKVQLHTRLCYQGCRQQVMRIDNSNLHVACETSSAVLQISFGFPEIRKMLTGCNKLRR